MAIPSNAIEGPRADARLVSLDLTAEELREIMLVGYIAAESCTQHDPRSLPGTLAWGKAIGHLRDITKVRAWTPDRSSNFETAVHPTNAHAIAIARGTSATGRTNGVPPRTKTPKGPATSRAVKKNKQMSLGEGTEVFAGTGEPVDDENRVTWILLHYFDKESEEIRLELSQPLEMSGKQITAWRERIIIAPIAFSSEVEISFEDEDEEQIEIDVSRKAD
jgi:hypothetical protein